jgi:hypothetical protein
VDTQTAALALGGTSPPATIINQTEEYDGTILDYLILQV